jgi:ABC-type sugar transport system ATPase subunit
MEPNREPDAVATPILEAHGLSRSFRGLQALVDYDLHLPPLTIHGVIGPNGAGKTTLFHLLSGFLKPSSGTISFEGRDITGSAAFKVSRMGIGRTFQNIRLFGELSVLDNVKIALQRHSQRSLIGTLISSPSFRRSERELDDRAIELLRSAEAYARREDLGPLLTRIRWLLERLGQHADGELPGRLAELSAAERRVAQLVVVGKRNREIAEELGVSVKSVEWHVSHILRKLSISSRGELADALAQPRQNR